MTGKNFTNKKIYSVAEITREIKQLIENKFFDIWLEGEISNLREHSSGHVYLSLKDDDAVISAVIFRASDQKIIGKLKDGEKVLVHGHLSVYEKRGGYQIIIDFAEVKGLGDLSGEIFLMAITTMSTIYNSTEGSDYEYLEKKDLYKADGLGLGTETILRNNLTDTELDQQFGNKIIGSVDLFPIKYVVLSFISSDPHQIVFYFFHSVNLCFNFLNISM